jgi:hypothetical protein
LSRKAVKPRADNRESTVFEFCYRSENLRSRNLCVYGSQHPLLFTVAKVAQNDMLSFNLLECYVNMRCRWISFVEIWCLSVGHMLQHPRTPSWHYFRENLTSHSEVYGYGVADWRLTNILMTELFFFSFFYLWRNSDLQYSFVSPMDRGPKFDNRRFTVQP